MQFAYALAKPTFTDEQLKSIVDADAVIVCVHTRESEGTDRAYELSGNQSELIKTIAGMNKKVIVVLEAGGNVGMPWIDQASALIDAWYPGQAGGKAIAEIIFGDTNPSGHLPDSFEKAWPDSPAFGHYPGNDTIEYSEGLYVGYRWFDKKNIEPRFPFGFGLSYTTFDIKNLIVSGGAASMDVINTGSKAGAMVAQLYVRPPAGGAVDRPTQELKGFSRVELQPGESKSISIPLNSRSFSYWDVATHGWKVEPGDYQIAVGRSSRDICATATFANVK